MSENAKVCQNCYWYRSGMEWSDKILCINLDRENWKGIEPENTCKDFILPCDFKPDPMWSALVKAVNEKIIERKDGYYGSKKIQEDDQ